MNDLDFTRRNPQSFTGRFIIPTGCKCRVCGDSLPWRTMGLLALIFGVLILALN